ncbi:MAG: response regulator [Verrucomicrobia bacterium]|nr:response regulator [Verrucomicrobiota bacterium]
MNTTPAVGPVPRLAVLLVDDEPAVLETFRLGLAHEFDLDLAGSAAEAERKMETRHYDVLVCDQLMPGEEGLHFLIRASERHPRTQRILITGYMNPENLAHNMELAGLSACVLKPAKAAELAAAIRRAAK